MKTYPEYAEDFATPLSCALSAPFPRRNDLGDLFFLRWARIRFRLDWGPEMNLKVVVKVWHADNSCDAYVVPTDPVESTPFSQIRVTRDIFVHPSPRDQGPVTGVKFSYILHLRGRSFPSRHEYLLFHAGTVADPSPYDGPLPSFGRTPNPHRTVEADPALLQRDSDYASTHLESLGATPKFTKGLPYHPFHPRQYIHQMLDAMIARHRSSPSRDHSVKICVDCIDDDDFVRHVLHAYHCGVPVQIIVDWRKLTLTNSPNYTALKRAGLEILGEVCTCRDPAAEVATDMHNKFITFGDEDAVIGSFNIGFGRWGDNWESGMTFRSRGVVRLLDNIFQSIRGGVIQPRGVDPFAPFNLLYTFGATTSAGGAPYLPHHAILSEINRATSSISIALFLIGELRGPHGSSVIDALIRAKDRGVSVRVILNGHLAREGSPATPHPWDEEIRRPLLPAVRRLAAARVPVALVYGQHDRPVPYSPLHSKQCVIDSSIILDGSFNWYNTSVYSHDLLIVMKHHDFARLYLQEHEQILSSFRVLWL